MNVKSYIIQLKKFAVERAISGAQARVVTKLLGNAILTVLLNMIDPAKNMLMESDQEETTEID